MKKVNIKKSTADLSVKTTSKPYKDEVQKMVEYYFAQGLEVQEIAEKLGIIDMKDITRRYQQVLRQYLEASEQLTMETTKIEVLKILKRSLHRRDKIAQEVERRERRIIAGIDDDEFPNKEIANLREEDKFIFKIMTDLDKHLKPKGVGMSDKTNDILKEADNAEITRNKFKELIFEYKSNETEVLTETLEEDIRASMEQDDW